jgi:hypothetical protein
MDVDTVLDELFAAPREEFTALRDTRVKQARTEGDTELVGQLKRLRKPTVAAWLVNQVSRAHPEDVERLAKVGDALRAAHHALAGDQLRDLSRERNELIHVLTGHARAIAGEAGQALGDRRGDSRRGRPVGACRPTEFGDATRCAAGLAHRGDGRSGARPATPGQQAVARQE